jgi:hypothetical protein
MRLVGCLYEENWTFFLKAECKIINTFKGVISDFRREADENCVLLSRYAASSSNSLTHVSGQPAGPETSVRNNLYSLRNNPEERSSLSQSTG